MAKRKTTRKKPVPYESDEAYFLKLVMYLIIGSLWLRIENYPDWIIPLPIGLVVGLWFTAHDHFQIDRKIEYAVLLVATLIGFWLPIGLVVNI